MARRQTAEQKKQSDIELIKNSIAAFERYITNNPNDQWNDGRRRQMAQLQDKLQMMTA